MSKHPALKAIVYAGSMALGFLGVKFLLGMLMGGEADIISDLWVAGGVAFAALAGYYARFKAQDRSEL